MERIYLPPANLAPAKLDNNTPTGLFQSMHGREGLTWVLDVAGEKWGVVLTGSEARLNIGWKLQGTTSATRGISFGAVELELDPASVRDGRRDVPAGAIVIENGSASIMAREPDFSDPLPLPVCASGVANSPESYHFSRWRLIQRDPEGRPIVLYEGDAKPAAPAAA